MKPLNLRAMETLSDLREKPEQFLHEVRAVLQDTYGITIPDIQESPPEPSEFNNYDSMTNQALGNLHAMYVGYASNVGYRATEAKITEAAAKKALDLYKAKRTLELVVEGHSKVDAAELVKSDETYLELDGVHFMHSSVRQLLETRRDAFSDVAAAVSRIITIRTEEMRDGFRDNGIQGRKFGSGGRPVKPGAFRPAINTGPKPEK